MNGLTQVIPKLRRPFMPVAPIPASTCSRCAEFLGSERTPSVGNCLLHEVQVLAQDQACSQYYQDDHPDDPVCSDDEF